MHWTQTAEGKKKLAAKMRKSWKKRRLNGHERAVKIVEGNKVTWAKMTRSHILDLAQEGARTRLRTLEAEANKLRIFLGEIPEAPK